MEKINQKQGEFYGTTTVGTKGQVVIPAKARTAMNLHESEKMLVFSMGGDILMLVKVSNLKKIASHLASRLDLLQKIIHKNNVK